MRNASSASATWSDCASASEYTATVWIPMPRAVLATRAAISPRLAIRIFWNTGRALFFPLRALLWLRLRHPGRGALLEEGAHALPAFVGRPGAADAPGHIGDQLGRDRPQRDRADQLLGRRVRSRRALDELAQDRVHRRIQLLGPRELLHESDAIGLRRGETLGREEIPLRGALAHRGEDVGTDSRGGQSEAHFGHAEFGIGGGDGDIAGGGEPHASR